MPTMKLHGIGVSPGMAIGEAVRMSFDPLPDVTIITGGSAEEEIAAAKDAILAVAGELEGKRSLVSEEIAAILSTQVAILGDPVLSDSINTLITGGTPAPLAVRDALWEFRDQLLEVGGYFAERAYDLDDLSQRVIAKLLNLSAPGIPDRDEPFILVCKDLSPADAATLDAAKVLAILTELGGPTSHTALIAKSLGIPTVVACPLAAGIPDGERILVDGSLGTVEFSPNEVEAAQKLADQARKLLARASSFGPGRTRDGVSIELLVNVGARGDFAGAAKTDSEGVGLFRTEFLFLNRTEAPDCDEQSAIYKELFDAFAGKKVVVRTLDAGADKPLDFVNTGNEANPALGLRGFRTYRHHPEVLVDQLRAIANARAGSNSDVWVMAPMVSTPAEAKSFVELAHRVDLPVGGCMVEVPAAALCSSSILRYCDFLSIGTNDLSQYTYACDRETGALPELLDPWQPALLKLVKLTSLAGRESHKPVGVCGEAASDPMLALVLVGLGITSLSMTPGSIAAVRTELIRHSLDELERIAHGALDAEDGLSARAFVNECIRDIGCDSTVSKR